MASDVNPQRRRHCLRFDSWSICWGPQSGSLLNADVYPLGAQFFVGGVVRGSAVYRPMLPTRSVPACYAFGFKVPRNCVLLWTSYGRIPIQLGKVAVPPQSPT